MFKKGSLNPNYKDGRCLKEYFCQCGQKITHYAVLYGKGICRKCEGKRKHELGIFNIKGKNNPRFGKGFEIEGANNPNWCGGRSFEPYPVDWNKRLKIRIRERDNYTCQNPECSKPNSNFVHHIDYNKDNLDEKNLITTCNSCHSKTNFNRQYWQVIFTTVIGESCVKLV